MPFGLATILSGTEAAWLWGVVCAIGVLAGFAISWNRRLRKEIQRQTRRLEDSLSAEKGLRERYRELFENASDVILQTNLDGRLVGANHAAEKLLAQADGPLLGQFIEELFTSEDMGWYFDLLDETRTRGTVRVEREVMSMAGEATTLELNCRMLANNGFETGLQAIGRDITERIRLQEEMKRARLSAESNALAKSIFLANMSHEIRTPMNGILGMTRLLMETSLDIDQRDQAQTIQHSAESLLTILNDVLDLSRIEAGKLELAKESFDLPGVFEEVMELLAPIARTKDREFIFDFAPGLPTQFLGDAGRLRQVVLNLVGNALKFTESGFIETRVSGNRNELFCDLLIEVEDSGIGMTNAQAARMFQPFEQAEPGTQRQFGGTGLGLALSKKIVDAMGGEIGVRSTPGTGSVFWFILRIQEDRRGGTVFVPRLPRLKVCCDLDGRRLGKVLSNWLTVHGAVLTRDQPDVWLTDTPNIATAAPPGAQRILLSRDPSPTVGMEAERLGFRAWLRQPIRQRELLEALTTLRAVGADAFLTPGRLRKQEEIVPIAATLGGLRVLLAEDNKVNQKVVSGILKRTGCHFEIAENGALAVAALTRGHFDVVLMDCHMPVMDGYTAARRIRESPSPTCLIPIVALTAGALAEDRVRCAEAGMGQFLAKPFRAEDLINLLRAIHEAPKGIAALQ